MIESSVLECRDVENNSKVIKCKYCVFKILYVMYGFERVFCGIGYEVFKKL